MEKEKEGKVNTSSPPPAVNTSPPVNTSSPHWFDSIKKFAFIIASTLIVFAAARNTITWHVQKFWGASGNFWQNQFDSAYQYFGNNDFNVGVYATFVIPTVFYLALNVILIVMDLTGKPYFLQRYKIQPDKNSPLQMKDLVSALLVVVFNQFFVSFPLLFVLYPLSVWRGCPFNGDLPTFQWVLFELAVFTLVEEVGFYYSHRLMHHPRLYKMIHKRHHEWTAPIGITSLYAHPIEHLFSNILPPALGPLLMGSHVATTWLWFCLALWSTTNSHSGYHFPFMPSPEAHDFHHLKFNNNFGVLGVLDRLHGTDEHFRKTKAYQRHVMMLTLVPPRVSIPDSDK